jgi:hypothetical protein
VALVGTEKQVTLQQAGGRGPWDACEALYYDGVEIAPTEYAFHAGGETDAADTFFPSDAPHPGAAYVNTRLPAGMAADDRPEKLVGIYRTLKTADYDDHGRQLDSGGSLVSASANPLDHFFYMPNPANVTADYLLRWFGRPATRVNWQAWRDWRDWCWETITWDDGTSLRTVRRFECHVFFLPPFRLAQVLDRIAQISCADWQDGGGELHFLTPANRAPVFTLDLSKVAVDSFKTWRVDRRERPREVVVQYRDLDDPVLYPADPVVIPATGTGEPYVVNMGSSTRSQAERVGYYWKRVLSDSGVMAEVKAAPDTYALLPADSVLLTHDEVDWAAIPFQVVTKDEHGDADLGDTLTVQIYPDNLYSDTDHGPATTPLPANRPNPYSAPPVVLSLTLGYSQKTLPNGDAAAVITGEATFQAFAGVQIGRVWWKRSADPDTEWELYPLPPFVPEPVTLRAPFELVGVDPDIYDVKVVTYSQAGVSADFAEHPASTVTIQIRDSLFKLIESLRVRSFDAGLGVYVGWIPDPSSAGLALGMNFLRNRQLGEDYEQIARFRLQATGGVTTTALDAVTDVTAFDSVSVVRVNFQSGTPQNATQDEARAGANKILISGDNGVEAVNFTTASAISGTLYDLSGLWRGRYGTGPVARLGAASGAAVLAVNDAVQFVGYEREDVGREWLLKAVTFGQQAADVSPVSFIPSGISGRYTEPSNLILTRTDGTTGSPLLARWGLPSGSQFSADERYLVRILWDGVEQRRHTVQGHYNEPFQGLLVFGSSSLVTAAEDGTVESPGDISDTAILRSSQIVYGDSRVKWYLGSRRPPKKVNLVGASVPCARDTATNEIVAVDHYFEDGDWLTFVGASPLLGLYYVVNATSDRFQISPTPGGSPASLAGTASEFTMSYPSPMSSPAFASLDGVVDGGSVYVRPVSVAFDYLRRPAVAGNACMIEVTNGVLRFYVSDMQVPVFEAGAPNIRFPYQVEVTVGAADGGAQAADRITIEHANARSFLYTRRMQENDFPGGVPTTVTVAVSRFSEVGAGVEAVAVG